MRQLLQNMKSGDVRLEEVPVPAPGIRGVLVRTGASVVSAGTEKMVVDMGKKSLLGKAMARPDLVRKVVDKALKEGVNKAYQTVNARLSEPMALGYSAAGTVVEAGIQVPGLQPGQRVACAGAGYANHAEFIAVPQNLVVPVPDGVSTEDAAFTTLGAIALQGLRMADPKMGENFLVIGLGLLGQITVQLLLANGCRVIGSDLDAALAERIDGMGAAGVRPGEDLVEACAAFTQGHGVDGVIICASTPSSEPVTQAAEVTREKGRVVVVGAVGMEVPRAPYYHKEISLMVSRSYGPGRYDPVYEEGGHDYPYGYVRFTEQRNMQAFLGLLAAGRVDVSGLVSHRFDFDEALQAYELIDGSRTEPYLGIVLTYGGAEAVTGAASRIELRPAPVKGDRIGVSVIGAGQYATGVLLPLLAKESRLAPLGMATASGRTAAEAAKAHGFSYCAGDVQELLADDSDLVMVLTRHDSHSPLTAAALAAGKHVFVEKPLALDRDGLAEVCDALGHHAGGQLMAGFNRRFAPLTRQVTAHFADCAGPKVVSMRVNAGEIAADHWTQNPEQGGGRLIGEACHFVDLAEALCGSEITAVQAVAAGDAAKSALLNDNFTLSLNFADGSIATITYTAKGAPGMGKEYIEVFGGGRSAIIDDFRRGLLFEGSGSPTKIGSNTQDKGQAAMLAALVDGLLSGQAAIPVASLLRTTAATFAAVDSIASGGRRTIDLSSFGEFG